MIIYMVYLLTSLIIIPVILTIVIVSPFDQKTDLQDKVHDEQQSDLGMMLFILMIVWMLMLARILYLMRKGKYNIRTKF